MEEEEGGRGGYARLLRGVRGPHGGDDSQTNASNETSTWEPENKFISAIFKKSLMGVNFYLWRWWRRTWPR